MRILLVNHEFTITGASTVFWRLARHLKARGHELGLYPCNPEDGPMKPRFEALGIAILGQAVVAEYDLVIANTVCAGGVVIQAGSFTPVIWFLHETEIGLQIILQTPALAEAFRTAAAVVYQTSHQAEMYRSFTYQLDPRKFAVIPNGIEPVPEHLPSVTEKGRALRIVQVGSVEPRKRPGDLIRAVVRSGIDADCVICGKFFVLDEEAQALVDARPGQFHFTGEVEPDEALAWMRSGDIYALVSASESQPVSVLEAAAMGKALLLTSLPSYAGAYTHGRNCLMAPAGHVEL
ncbi:MAG TPA: glycosyltransferase family 4 protein, partial [Acidocella sp.]|nr:glycosyltransferase family 4 protein [Acidocella sp.]